MLCELGRSIFADEPDGGLNPCSNGRCSASRRRPHRRGLCRGVLILVLMEDALRDYQNSTLLKNYVEVLILVLMEDALRVNTNYMNTNIKS